MEILGGRAESTGDHSCNACFQELVRVARPRASEKCILFSVSTMHSHFPGRPWKGRCELRSTTEFLYNTTVVENNKFIK